MDKIKELKKQILKMAYKSQEGHVASSFSCLDILYILYKNMDYNKDKFILSKGHAALALYVVLADCGILSNETLDTFCRNNTILSGHPHRKIPGVVCSTGSLGHGLGMACGLALAKKINNEEGTIYCLVGDQELLEGITFEACNLISHLKLDNLCVIVDNNFSTPVSLLNIESKFDSFGFEVSSIIGHNHCDLKDSINLKRSDKPKCIIAHTIKGYGINRMEKNPQEWHHRKISESEYNEMQEELS